MNYWQLTSDLTQGKTMMQMAQPSQYYASGTVHSVLCTPRANVTVAALHRPIPAPEPDPEPNPAPDAIVQVKIGRIQPADWDAMFRAIQTRLEHCVGEVLFKQPELALHDRHELTKTVVLECVEAMKQLHAALSLERQQSQQQSMH